MENETKNELITEGEVSIPSKMYRLMIYFAHSTIVLYNKTLVDNAQMTPQDFYDANKRVMQRVFDEALSIMEYELSYSQMMKACYCYLSSKYHPQDVNEIAAYTLNRRGRSDVGGLMHKLNK